MATSNLKRILARNLKPGDWVETSTGMRRVTAAPVAATGRGLSALRLVTVYIYDPYMPAGAGTLLYTWADHCVCFRAAHLPDWLKL
jgi:hypothetical protein